MKRKHSEQLCAFSERNSALQHLNCRNAISTKMGVTQKVLLLGKFYYILCNSQTRPIIAAVRLSHLPTAHGIITIVCQSKLYLRRVPRRDRMKLTMSTRLGAKLTLRQNFVAVNTTGENKSLALSYNDKTMNRTLTHAYWVANIFCSGTKKLFTAAVCLSGCFLADSICAGSHQTETNKKRCTVQLGVRSHFLFLF